MSATGLSIIKLGGAALTSAGGPDGLNLEVARRLAGEIVSLPKPLILVHGTGAVGKPPALEHGFADTGWLPGSSAAIACEIHRRLRALNQRFVQVLLEAGLPALGLDPAAIVAPDFGGLAGEGARDLLVKLSGQGVVPVLYGDMVPGDHGRFVVLSSDVIAAVLAMELQARHLIFLSDVPGVYADSTLPVHERTILAEFSPPDLDRPGVFGEQGKTDVSGGMKAKVRLALQASRGRETCWIGAAKTEGILTAFFQHGIIQGTRIIGGTAP